MRGLRQQLQENQQGDYQEIGELRKKWVLIEKV